MTDLIAELKALKEKATPGPFIVSTCASPEESKGEVTLDALRSGGMGEVVYRYKWIKNRADCDLDAALRNHLPTILARLEEGERMREALLAVDRHNDSPVRYDAYIDEIIRKSGAYL